MQLVFVPAPRPGFSAGPAGGAFGPVCFFMRDHPHLITLIYTILHELSIENRKV